MNESLSSVKLTSLSLKHQIWKNELIYQIRSRCVIKQNKTTAISHTAVVEDIEKTPLILSYPYDII